jgi:hypothetical protein
MNDLHDLEQRVSRFLLTEAPTVVPERLISATRDRVLTTRQSRRGPQLWWRGLGLAGKSFASGVAVLAIAVLATTLLLSNRSSPSIGSGVSPAPSTVPSVRASPSASSLSGSACPVVDGTCLSPGTFSSTHFLPRVIYTVPAGWALASDALGELDLEYGAGGFYTYPDGVTFHDAVSVFARPVAESATSAVPLSGVGTDATALAQWLAHHADLVASAPTPIAVGTAHGFRMVLSLPTGTRTGPDHCTNDHGEPRCESLFLSGDPAASYGFGLVGPEICVVYVLDLPSGETVMVVIDDADGAEQPALVAAAQPIVDSLTFAP